MTGTSSSKRSSSERVGEPPLDLGALRNPLSICLGRSGESGQSGNSVSELSIRSSRVSLYLVGIVAISDYPSAPPTTCLSTLFGRIMTIRFWRKRGVSTQVFPRRVYAPVKQTFSIGSIVHQPFAYQSLLFKPMAQTELRFFPVADLNYSNSPPDLWLPQQTWRIQLLSFLHKKKRKNGTCEVFTQGCNCLLWRRRRIWLQEL